VNYTSAEFKGLRGKNHNYFMESEISIQNDMNINIKRVPTKGMRLAPISSGSNDNGKTFHSMEISRIRKGEAEGRNSFSSVTPKGKAMPTGGK